MTAIQLQHRRGTDAENAVFVGTEGEMTYATDTKLLRIHDGITPGGKIVGRDEDANKTGQVATLTPVAGNANDYTLNLNGIEIDFTKAWRVYVQVESHPLPGATERVDILPPPGSGYLARQGGNLVSGSAVAPRFGDAEDGLEFSAPLTTQSIDQLAYLGALWELSCVPRTQGAITVPLYFITGYTNRQVEIRQNELATEVFTANSNVAGVRNVVLGGGEYGFKARTTSSTLLSNNDSITNYYQPSNQPAMPIASYVGIFTSQIENITIQQRYITASPPYDLGDGDIHGMLYLVLDPTTRDVIGHWAGRTPPWIYNGANKATADLYVDGVPHIWQRPSATIENIRNGEIPGKVSVPLTTAIKNTDMATIPQPFYHSVAEGETAPLVILADPMDECIMCMLDELNHGNHNIIQEIVDSRGFTIDAEPLSRAAPPGVAAHRITF